MKIYTFGAMLCMMALSVNGEGEHHGESCACAAKEEGFAIDCSNKGAMTTALAALAANNCESDCTSEICHRNFLIMQAHHDYCLESELPETIEDALHVYEDNCEECEIHKKYDPALPDCPALASCDNDSGNDAYAAMTAAGCVDDCSSDTCKGHWHVFKVVHDTCDEDALSEAAESNFHDIEEACAEDHGCNIKTGDAEELNPLICDDDSAANVVPFSSIMSFAASLAFVVATMM